jgi:hypothetical protein
MVNNGTKKKERRKERFTLRKVNDATNNSVVSLVDPLPVHAGFIYSYCHPKQYYQTTTRTAALLVLVINCV